MMTLQYPPKPRSTMAEKFEVVKIINYNKIETQGWVINQGEENEQTGNYVEIRGIPELSNEFDQEQAQKRLGLTLENKKVELRSAERIDSDTIQCDVFVNGTDVAKFFSDFK